MRSFLHRQQPVEPNLQEVPEISLNQANTQLAWLAERRCKNIPTYGAFIIRASQKVEPVLAARKLIDHYAKLVGVEPSSVRGRSFGGPADSSGGGLHADLPTDLREVRNDLTVHATRAGSFRFMLLPDIVLPLPLQPQKWASELLVAGTFEGENVSAVEADINAGDILLFDSSNPHLFANTAGPRSSTAFWLSTD